MSLSECLVVLVKWFRPRGTASEPKLFQSLEIVSPNAPLRNPGALAAPLGGRRVYFADVPVAGAGAPEAGAVEAVCAFGVFAFRDFLWAVRTLGVAASAGFAVVAGAAAGVGAATAGAGVAEAGAAAGAGACA